MKRSFTKSFKIQAVEKALSRGDDITLTEIASSLDIGASTLNKWIVKARNQEFDTVSYTEINNMSKDKRPQDWTLEERLNLVVSYGSLTGEALNEYCREQGVYPHHVKQWKLDFVNGNTQKTPTISPAEMKNVGRVFDLARQDTAGLEAYARQIASLMKGNRTVLSDRLESGVGSASLLPPSTAGMPRPPSRAGATPSTRRRKRPLRNSVRASARIRPSIEHRQIVDII